MPKPDCWVGVGVGWGKCRKSCSPRYKMRKSFRKTVHEIAVFSRADHWDVMHIWLACVCGCVKEKFVPTACRERIRPSTCRRSSQRFKNSPRAEEERSVSFAKTVCSYRSDHACRVSLHSQSCAYQTRAQKRISSRE